MPRKRHAGASSALSSNLQLLAPSPASARVMASFASDLHPVATRTNPCRYALRLDFDLPATVFGSVLRLALTRLAAICFQWRWHTL